MAVAVEDSEGASGRPPVRADGVVVAATASGAEATPHLLTPTSPTVLTPLLDRRGRSFRAKKLKARGNGRRARLRATTKSLKLKGGFSSPLGCARDTTLRDCTGAERAEEVGFLYNILEETH